MTNIIDQINQEQMQNKNIPEFSPGDTVQVQVKVKEGARERLQTFEGIVLFTKSVLTGGKKTDALFSGGVYKMAHYVFCANREYLRALELLCGKMGIDFSNFTPQKHNYANIKMGGSVICHDEDENLPMEQKRLYNQFIFHDGATIQAEYFDGNMQPLTYEQVKA